MCSGPSPTIPRTTLGVKVSPTRSPDLEDKIKTPDQLGQAGFERLDRWRFYSLVATMAGAFGLAALGAVSFGAPMGSLDGAYIAVSAVTLLASSALTVVSFRLAAWRTGAMPVRRTAAGHGIRRATLMALGLVALIGNVVAGLSGRFSLLTWILAALVGALILLIRYRDQYRHQPSG